MKLIFLTLDLEHSAHYLDCLDAVLVVGLFLSGLGEGLLLLELLDGLLGAY